jgi:hypothetical protein
MNINDMINVNKTDGHWHKTDGSINIFYIYEQEVTKKYIEYANDQLIFKLEDKHGTIYLDMKNQLSSVAIKEDNIKYNLVVLTNNLIKILGNHLYKIGFFQENNYLNEEEQEIVTKTFNEYNSNHKFEELQEYEVGNTRLEILIQNKID